MQFYCPVKLYEGENVVRAHGAELAALGTKALIVTGRHSAKACGAYDDVAAALDAAGVGHALFDAVEENPSVETVMAGRDLGVAEGADFVIGIGGGSPLDACKAIALMIRHREADAPYLYDGEAPSDALPVVCVPTTCGTGSEVTAISVLTRHDLGVKGSIPHRIFARLALLDGRYLAAAPRQILANTGVDAFGHMVESVVNTQADDYSRMFAFAGLRLWQKSKAVLAGERAATAADYCNMINASAMGGMAIAHTGTTLPHGLSYALTYHLGMAHGAAIGYFEARYLDAAPADQRAAVLEASGFASTAELQAFYDAVCDSRMVTRETLTRAVDELMQSEKKLALAPFDASRDVVERIAGLR